MDNITHTLVGAALAESGLKKRTPLASATLMIGANFPDIDVIAVPLGHSLEWRRGITHGFLALAILPFVLAWLVRLYDRGVRLRRAPDAPPADFRQLVVLSALSIITHPTLDYMNTYGMRWLMPFVDRWFYADGLFIVDLWLLAALAIGVVWSRRGRLARPASVALVFLAAYTTLNLLVTGMGRRAVAGQYPGVRSMVAPQPLWSLTREVVLDLDREYQYGSYSPFRGLRLTDATIPKGDGDPAARAAMRHPDAQRFLHWARFPFYRVLRGDGGATVVRISDARYSGPSGGGWASVEVRLP